MLIRAAATKSGDGDDDNDDSAEKSRADMS